MAKPRFLSSQPLGPALAPLTKTALTPDLSVSTLHGPQTVSSAYVTSLHSCGAQLTRAKRQAQKILRVMELDQM